MCKPAETSWSYTEMKTLIQNEMKIRRNKKTETVFTQTEDNGSKMWKMSFPLSFKMSVEKFFATINIILYKNVHNIIMHVQGQ